MAAITNIPGNRFSGRSLSGSARLDRDPSLDQGPDEQVEQVELVAAQLVEAEDDAAELLAQFGRFRSVDRRTRRTDDLERMLDPEAGDKLDELANALKGQTASSSRGVVAVLREVMQRFPDGSDALLALRELRRRRKLDGEPTEVLDEAIDELMRGNEARAIKAGINVALKARAFATQLRLDPRRLRELYRQFLEFAEAYRVVYESWIEEFGIARRKRILEYVGAALKYDMQSLDPSGGCAAEFGPLLTSIGHLRALSSADAIFLGRLLDPGPESVQLVSEELAIHMMLTGLQRPYDMQSVLAESLGSVLSVLPAERCSEVMQRVSRAFATIPSSLYDSIEERHAVLDTLRDCMTALHTEESKQKRRATLSVSRTAD
ncbi:MULTISPECIES: type III secretion system gatekeeper subunit SctW [unclassified Burkholderia]|uniref:type III secretion system gatekeeper subunit SctW n=1 Tax=unclassified Burkholderia TaxID=2613784 RepID=UPI000753BD38|nr:MULTISPECIES: type III secretion system gatekeeper subunit SctW [unclassified Burkholderia]KUY50674.1 hypothetical protein WS45_28455 [Burkholderia sp. RF2-non_BP3]KUY81447.1 hypothetical protein WS46_16695 [Burkholderia sp. RF4-BP95]KUY96695.1 hypothetical protein WS49_22580 [Burkholderia sp. RF7-non_BP4]KUZ02910.1 hypothetical protein WS48_04360 [Burkholderia sp. RF7-non_BP1]